MAQESLPVAPSDDAPKMHPRARRISKAQPPADVQHPSLTFNTNHVFEINNGQASVCVNDTLEMRAAFLKYCNSSMRPTEMHRMAGPFMTAPNFMALCKDIELAEPQGPLSPMVIGICYATLKSDDDEGLTYASFLDALMELAFEAGRNVAGQLQAIYATRAQPPPQPRPPGLSRCESSTRVRVSEPGFAPQAPLQPRFSEAGTMPLPSSPIKDRSLQPRFSETGRFQRPSALFRSLDTSSSIISAPSSVSSMSPKAALEEELRSSSANGVTGEGPKVPRPPSSLIRTSLSGAAPSRPTFRPSVGQRPLKARGLGLAMALDLDDGGGRGEEGSDVPPAHHALNPFMIGWPAGGRPGAGAEPDAAPVRSSPLSRISAKFQVPDADDSSPLSRISAKFQVPGADDDDDDALFPSPRVRADSLNVRSSTASIVALGNGRPPSASSAASRQSVSGRPLSSLSRPSS